jgi:hypothetical protein
VHLRVIVRCQPDRGLVKEHARWGMAEERGRVKGIGREALGDDWERREHRDGRIHEMRRQRWRNREVELSRCKERQEEHSASVTRTRSGHPSGSLPLATS